MSIVFLAPYCASLFSKVSDCSAVAGFISSGSRSLTEIVHCARLPNKNWIIYKSINQTNVIDLVNFDL